MKKSFLLIAILSLAPASFAFACSVADLIVEVQILESESQHCAAACSIQPILNEVENLKSELEKFKNGNASAGTRARKAAKNIKNFTKDLRVCLAQDPADQPACTRERTAAKDVSHAAQQIRVCIAQNS